MPRRFIAGAVCPRCGQMDKLVVDTESNLRECVSCGFSEERPADNAPGQTGGELKTRVNRPAARLVETPTEAVKLITPDDPPADSDKD